MHSHEPDRSALDDSSASDLETAGNPYHVSRRTRLILRLVAVILAVSMTALFLRGLINS